VKKARDLLEYVIVHELVHLLEPTHSERFVALMTEHHPGWREALAELNAAAACGGTLGLRQPPERPLPPSGGEIHPCDTFAVSEAEYTSRISDLHFGGGSCHLDQHLDQGRLRYI
jgi:hypothetical protein